MKKFGFISLGAILGAILCIGAAWLLGSAFGPLYQGEDEAARNFKIFLVMFIVMMGVGGGLGLKAFQKQDSK